MNRQLKQLTNKSEKLQKQIEKVKKVAERKPIEVTKLKELLEQYDLPPYSFTVLAFEKYGVEVYETFAEEPENGRVRGKIETGIMKTLGGISAGAMTAITVPFVAALESVFALPILGGTAIQSGIYNNYNKNIEKAKSTVTKLEQELETINKQIAELSSDIEATL